MPTGPVAGPGRCLYRSTQGVADPDGDLFAVVGASVYFVDPNWNFNLLGSLQTAAATPVSMADNGTTVLIVDNTSQGYTINIANKAFAQLEDPNFYGSTRADFLDSFLILNKPGTNEWYSTTSLGVSPFNPLFIGVKTAWPDIVQCVVACERQAFVFGSQKCDVWYNAGSTPFPFQILPGVIVEQGCQAAYSPAKMDAFVYWLAAAPEGGYMAMRSGSQNVAQRISNHAVEFEWKSYPTVEDAIGSVYQIAGHSFYKLHFPTADKTWGFDAATNQWHEDLWIDTNGNFHRARNTFNAFAYGKNLGLDWANGTLYEVTAQEFTDAGAPIVWIRSFPHIIDELKWVQHPLFMADVETGTRPGTGNEPQFLSPWSEGWSDGFGPLTKSTVPVVNFRMSRDAGETFGKYRPKKNVASGHYRPAMRWRGLGVARDAVFEVSSTAEMSGALNGAYIEPIEGTS